MVRIVCENIAWLIALGKLENPIKRDSLKFGLTSVGLKKETSRAEEKRSTPEIMITTKDIPILEPVI